MAKIIQFNNKNYSIDDASLATPTAELKSHFSTAMNGEGATVNFGGTTYNVDSTKLSTATTDFVAHLGTIAGTGLKVTINGVEYAVSSDKVAGAVAEIEAVLGGLNNPDAPTPTEERLEGDGAEYYTLAPTALSFRSTAPLNELQEIQINGVTVDPSNYTLEEGSTIVTFPIDYLKTLNVGSYEVAVASESKTVKGGFTVAAPELNEHGFYYNQPYTAYIDDMEDTAVFFLRENNIGELRLINGNYSEIIVYATKENNNITVQSYNFGIFNFTTSSDGMGMYCDELAINFMIGNEFSIADQDYLYIYNATLDGYEVTAIDQTKSFYGAVKARINGINTVKLADFMFVDISTLTGNANMTVAPEIPRTTIVIGEGAFGRCSNLESVEIPDSVTSIEIDAFAYCNNLKNITFNGTIAQWNTIEKGENWNRDVPATHVQCSDGQVAL